jgi:quinol-cytochrome oxidoreductase complex cytochrome b subunit
MLLAVLFSPQLFMEAENFMPANAMVTPAHIVPE